MVSLCEIDGAVAAMVRVGVPALEHLLNVTVSVVTDAVDPPSETGFGTNDPAYDTLDDPANEPADDESLTDPVKPLVGVIDIYAVPLQFNHPPPSLAITLPSPDKPISTGPDSVKSGGPGQAERTVIGIV
jgi:hypothetical protein